MFESMEMLFDCYKTHFMLRLLLFLVNRFIPYHVQIALIYLIVLSYYLRIHKYRKYKSP